MVAEYDERTSAIENIFGQPGFPILTPEEVYRYLILVSKNKLDRLSHGQQLDLDQGKKNLNILLTGDSRWGKTTTCTIVALEVSGYEIPLVIEPDFSFDRRPIDLKHEDATAINFNFGYAVSGLGRLIKNWNLDRPQITIYERGFIDHFVFAEALNEWYGKRPSYTETINAFKIFFRSYLGYLDGIIICNSTVETDLANGSTLPRELLELLRQGYQNLPSSLSELTRGGIIDPIPTIELNFEKLDSPVQTLKRSIYTMIKWNLDGKIMAEQPNVH